MGLPALFAYLVILGLGYVVRPNYLDPGESHVTMLSLLLTEGKAIYSPEDNADLANTWYGQCYSWRMRFSCL